MALGQLQFVREEGTMVNSFERMARELGLSPGEYEGSAQLKDWARRNMAEKYVPTFLLRSWGLERDEVDEAA